MSTSDEKSRGFAVSDRRSFTTEGEPKPATAPPPAASSTGASTAKQPASESKPAKGSDDARLPPVDFHTFVLSLGSSALIHLGDLERAGKDEPGKSEKDLPLAKNSIDILSMLQEKTRGNLTNDEAQLLESLLYDLRLRYVAAAK
jgi:hypothetical protein